MIGDTELKSYQSLEMTLKYLSLMGEVTILFLGEDHILLKLLQVHPEGTDVSSTKDRLTIVLVILGQKSSPDQK